MNAGSLVTVYPSPPVSLLDAGSGAIFVPWCGSSLPPPPPGPLPPPALAAACGPRPILPKSDRRLAHVHQQLQPSPRRDDQQRRRRRVTGDQLAVLERVFEETPKPSTDARSKLANTLGMPIRAVQIWFQNRRAKTKCTAAASAGAAGRIAARAQRPVAPPKPKRPAKPRARAQQPKPAAPSAAAAASAPRAAAAGARRFPVLIAPAAPHAPVRLPAGVIPVEPKNLVVNANPVLIRAAPMITSSESAPAVSAVLPTPPAAPGTQGLPALPVLLPAVPVISAGNLARNDQAAHLPQLSTSAGSCRPVGHYAQWAPLPLAGAVPESAKASLPKMEQHPEASSALSGVRGTSQAAADVGLAALEGDVSATKKDAAHHAPLPFHPAVPDEAFAHMAQPKLTVTTDPILNATPACSAHGSDVCSLLDFADLDVSMTAAHLDIPQSRCSLTPLLGGWELTSPADVTEVGREFDEKLEFSQLLADMDALYPKGRFRSSAPADAVISPPESCPPDIFDFMWPDAFSITPPDAIAGDEAWFDPVLDHLGEYQLDCFADFAKTAGSGIFGGDIADGAALASLAGFIDFDCLPADGAGRFFADALDFDGFSPRSQGAGSPPPVGTVLDEIEAEPPTSLLLQPPAPPAVARARDPAARDAPSPPPSSGAGRFLDRAVGGGAAPPELYGLGVRDLRFPCPVPAELPGPASPAPAAHQTDPDATPYFLPPPPVPPGLRLKRAAAAAAAAASAADAIPSAQFAGGIGAADALTAASYARHTTDLVPPIGTDGFGYSAAHHIYLQ